MIKECKTWKLIPKSEIERVFTESDTAGAELARDFLCFEDVYEEVTKYVDKDTTIIDFGCAYAPQAWWFTGCKKYIGINPSFGNNVRFKTYNSEIHLMTGQEYIKKMPKDMDLSKVIAVCSYVPDLELQQMVADKFPYCYVVYCDEVIAMRFPEKGDTDESK